MTETASAVDITGQQKTREQCLLLHVHVCMYVNAHGHLHAYNNIIMLPIMAMGKCLSLSMARDTYMPRKSQIQGQYSVLNNLRRLCSNVFTINLWTVL